MSAVRRRSCRRWKPLAASKAGRGQRRPMVGEISLAVASWALGFRATCLQRSGLHPRRASGCPRPRHQSPSWRVVLPWPDEGGDTMPGAWQWRVRPQGPPPDGRRQSERRVPVRPQSSVKMPSHVALKLAAWRSTRHNIAKFAPCEPDAVDDRCIHDPHPTFAARRLHMHVWRRMIVGEDDITAI